MDDKQSGVGGLVVICTFVAVLVLLIDWKIKADILAAAKQAHDDAERLERIVWKYAEVVSGSPDAGPAGDHDMVRASGMEAPTSLADFAHGMGPAKGSRPRKATHSRSGSAGVEIPKDLGDVE